MIRSGLIGLMLVLVGLAAFMSGCASTQWQCQYDNSHDARLTCSYLGIERFSTESLPPPAAKPEEKELLPKGELLDPSRHYPYRD